MSTISQVGKLSIPTGIVPYPPVLLKLGIPIVSEKQTTANFLEHWLKQVVTPRVRPKTLRTYSDHIKIHIAPALGEIPLGKLSPQKRPRVFKREA